MRRLIVAAAASCVLALPAWATGNLGCSVDDAAMELNIESVISYGFGEPIVSLRGEIKLKDKAALEHFGTIEFNRNQVSQYWLEGSDLRLYIYRDLEVKSVSGSLDLVIKTLSVDDEGGFEGRYRLEVSYRGDADTGESQKIEKEGPITCFAG